MAEAMWQCDRCGERENESRYKFCYACGAPKPEQPEADSPEDEMDELFDAAPETPQAFDLEAQHAEAPAHEQGWRLPKPLSAIGHKIKQAFPTHGDELNHVALSPEAHEKLNMLVHAGVFDTREAAASHLIERGIEAEAALFDYVQQKLSEIENLRSELRNLLRDES